MKNYHNVPFMISIPQEYRDLLHIMAAQQKLLNPSVNVTAARVGREIIVKHLESMNQENRQYGKCEL